MHSSTQAAGREVLDASGLQCKHQAPNQMPLCSWRAQISAAGQFRLLPTPLGAACLLRRMPEPNTVRALEQQLLALPQVDLQTQHVVHGGMCVRTIFVPAGVALTGAITNADNVCIVSGDITVTTDDGPQRLTGFHVLPARAGFKRAGIAHTDTYWTTIWRTELQDIVAIEDEMTNESALLQTRRPGIEMERRQALEG